MDIPAIVVMSGKGGVGKSSVAVQLALALAGLGLAVGVVDADVCGPSVARLLGLEGARVTTGADGRWLPVEGPHSRTGGKIRAMSMAFLLPSADDAVIWRGPKKTAMVRQFLEAVAWGDTRVLVVDTPPGTSDEHMALAAALAGRPHAAVLVTTPQRVALADVLRQLAFCREVRIPVAGLLENMSGYACPHCAACTNVFSSRGGASLCAAHGVPLLGTLPIAPRLGALLDASRTEPCDLPAAYAQTLPELHATVSRALPAVLRAVGLDPESGHL